MKLHRPLASIAIVILASSLLTACGASSQLDDGASSGGGEGGGGVTGTFTNRYFLVDGSTVTKPADLTGMPIQALVQEGSDWTTYLGTGHSDGTFTIPGVPEGPYVLAMPPFYRYTSSREVDLQNDFIGRSDAAESTSATLEGSLQGLAPWVSSDDIWWFCPGSGGAVSSDMAAVAGATSLVAQKGAWLGGLVDGSKGDVLYATQAEQVQAPGGHQVKILTRSTSFTGVEMANGEVTSVSGTMAPPSAVESVALDLRMSQFAALLPQVNPTAMDQGATARVSTAPGVTVTGLLGMNANLLTFSGPGKDVNLGSVKYGNPFPAAWGQVLFVYEQAVVPMPGAGAAGAISVLEPIEQAAAGPIRPVLTPVQEVKVEGQSAFGALSGISTTPTLTWSAPAVGTPSSYAVSLYQLPSTSVAVLFTTETSMTLPPGLLEEGNAYYFQITALAANGAADMITSAATP